MMTCCFGLFVRENNLKKWPQQIWGVWVNYDISALYKKMFFQWVNLTQASFSKTPKNIMTFLNFFTNWIPQKMTWILNHPNGYPKNDEFIIFDSRDSKQKGWLRNPQTSDQLSPGLDPAVRIIPMVGVEPKIGVVPLPPNHPICS